MNDELELNERVEVIATFGSGLELCIRNLQGGGDAHRHPEKGLCRRPAGQPDPVGLPGRGPDPGRHLPAELSLRLPGADPIQRMALPGPAGGRGEGRSAPGRQPRGEGQDRFGDSADTVHAALRWVLYDVARRHVHLDIQNTATALPLWHS